MSKDTGLATILIAAARTKAMEVARALQNSREHLGRATAVAVARQH